MSQESLKELRAGVMQATETHNEALTTHKTAMERYVANTTPENEAAMWEAFEKLIKANDARVSLFTQFMTAREQESGTANN